MKQAFLEAVAILKKFNLTISRWKKLALGFCMLLLLLGITFQRGLTDPLDFMMHDLVKRNLSLFFESHPAIQVIAIDMETLEGVGERWPWSRAKFAELVDRLASYKPRAVLLDILFKHPEGQTLSEGDHKLAESIRKAGNIALIDILEEEAAAMTVQERYFRSQKIFREAACCNGYIHSFIDPDSKIRRFSLFNRSSGEIGCLIRLAGFAGFAGLSEKTLPETSHLFFARKDGGIHLVSALDVFSGAVPKELLQDKILIVGATAPILHDYHKTCLGLISGPEILAAAFDTLVTGRASAPVESTFVRALLVFCGVIFGLLFVIRKFLAHELLSLLFFAGAVLFLFHLCGIFMLFPPLSCFFISWALVSLCYSIIESYIRAIELQVSLAEAEAAGHIQAGLFPAQFISTPGYLVRGRCIPCDKTGGDFFDYFELPDGNIVVLAGDVAGHGFSAAMITVIAKTTVQLLRQQKEFSPENLVKTLNQMIIDLVGKKKFMTFIVGHIDVSSGRLQLVIAGHLPPVVVSRDGVLTELMSPGYPMGVLKKLPTRVVDYQMRPGDSLVIFTDGIIEALNWENQPYAFSAWYEFLKKNMPAFSEKSDLGELLNGVEAHKKGRGFDDDVTYLVVQRVG